MRLLPFVFVALIAASCGGIRDVAPDGGTQQQPGNDGDVAVAEADTSFLMTPPTLDNHAEVSLAFQSSVAGATFVCALDDASPAACSSPHQVTVDEGEHTFTVAAVLNGVEDSSPATHVWTVDLTPPQTAITLAPAALDNSVAVSFEFTVDDSEATTVCSLDGGAALPCTSPHAVQGLTDGAHTLVVTATDLAGNVEPGPAQHDWVVDTAAPDTVIDDGPVGAIASTNARIAFSSIDAGAGATYECAVDAGSFAACTSPQQLTGLSQGAHAFRVRVTDLNGNVDPTPASREWTVDTVAPTVTITVGPSGPTNDSTPSFNFTVAGNPNEVECRIDSGQYTDCASSFTATTLVDSAHEFSIRALDSAGNIGTASRSFVVDTKGPEVTVQSGPNGLVGDSTPTFSWTSEAGATFECSLDGTAFATCSSAYTTPSLSQGAHTFAVRGADALGNLSAVVTREFVVDTVYPEIAITSGPGSNELWLASNVTFYFTATDANPVTIQCRRYVVGGSIPAYQSCTSPFTYSAGGGSNIRTLRFQIRVNDGLHTRTLLRTFRQAVPAG